MKNEKENGVRESFRVQAELCEQFGSLFTARLIRAVESELTSDTKTGNAVLNWSGPPEAKGDALALRLAGALHSLVLDKISESLINVYPPNTDVSDDMLRLAIRNTLVDYDDYLLPWLQFAPQTNEVGRSAVLYLGLMDVARKTGLPLKLYEIGSSAGLNLALDHYQYEFATSKYGKVDSPIQLVPDWNGPQPDPANVVVSERYGCDIAPLDVKNREHKLRLRSYVWPDQDDRQNQLNVAIDLVSGLDMSIEKSDAASWVINNINKSTEEGYATVLMHSLTFCYLPSTDQKAITKHMNEIGANATKNAPVAWLSYELNDENKTELTLQYWPSGETALLAQVHPHGRYVNIHQDDA